VATKKKAAKKGGVATLSAPGALNWIPFCVQVEHSYGAANPIFVSKAGGKPYPHSIYFLYQTPPSSGPGSVILSKAKGYFLGHPDPSGVPGTNDLTLYADANGMTEILTVDHDPKIVLPASRIAWTYLGAPLRLVSPGGGIIIDS
jgi:hypothetical protein